MAAGVNILPWAPKLFPRCLFQARKIFPAFGKLDASLVRFLAPSPLALPNKGHLIIISGNSRETGCSQVKALSPEYD